MRPIQPGLANTLSELEVISMTSRATVFAGHLADQAALHGVLAKIRDMNLPLISVSRVSLDSADDS